MEGAAIPDRITTGRDLPPRRNGRRVRIQHEVAKSSPASQRLPNGNLVWIRPKNVSPGGKGWKCTKVDILQALFERISIKTGNVCYFQIIEIRMGRLSQWWRAEAIRSRQLGDIRIRFRKISSEEESLDGSRVCRVLLFRLIRRGRGEWLRRARMERATSGLDRSIE
jgi:hypothetical protein